MSDYLSRELDQYTKEINKRLLDIVNLLINQYSDYDSATQFIDTIAAYVDNDMFSEARGVLASAERDPTKYFLLDQPVYDKDVIEGYNVEFIPAPPPRTNVFWFG